MNIHTTIKAVEYLNATLDATFDPAERAEFGNIRDRLVGALKKRGVFIGTEPKAKADSQPSLTPDPACRHCHGTGTGAGGVFTRCICTYQDGSKPATKETRAPQDRVKHIPCPKCGRPNQENNLACYHCAEPIAKRPPIMDEDDTRRDLTQLCAEQRDHISKLATERGKLLVAIGCLAADYEQGHIASARLRLKLINKTLRDA